MVTTVTLNPMLDKTVTVEALPRGAISRATRVSMVVGGKGVNVSRELMLLGEQTVATGFAGGEIGVLLERLLEEEGVPRRFVRVAGMTREGVTYLEPDGVMTSVFEPPHRVTSEEAARLLEECTLLARTSDWVVLSGSSPSSEADDLFRSIAAGCRAAGVRVVLDSYGDALRHGVASLPDMLKPNREEFESTFGGSVRGEQGLVDAAKDLVGRGIRFALVTDGPRPFAAAEGKDCWIVTPPRVDTVDPTGSGDTMVAALLHGLIRGRPFAECLAFASAAGAANARKREVARVTREEIMALLPLVTVEKV